MNSDKRWVHRPMQCASAIPRGDDALRDVQFPCVGGSRAADGTGSGSDRAGRNKKPHQDDGKKPKCPKFHRNHFRRCNKNVIKGYTARIMPEHSGFRKWNRFGLQRCEGRQRARIPQSLS